jgi:hypothetical protein
MSLKINKDNIFMINPKNGYFDDDNSDDSMANDFTIFVKVKINSDVLTQTDSFIISRNGAHSGISALKDEYEFATYIQYSYWFWDNSTSSPKIGIKQVHYKIEDVDLDDFIELALVHNSYERKMMCYYNGNVVGELKYTKDELPALYDDSPYWFGCGSMLTEGEIQDGEFEYDLAFSIRKVLNDSKIQHIIKNYKKKYCKKIFEDNLIFKKDWELTKEFTFFCDFEKMNQYKVWNYAFNGNFPQLYVKNVAQY